MESFFWLALDGVHYCYIDPINKHQISKMPKHQVTPGSNTQDSKKKVKYAVPRSNASPPVLPLNLDQRPTTKLQPRRGQA